MKKLIILFTACIALVSCHDILDRYPLEGPPSATFFSNEDELTLAINGAYESLYRLSNANVPYQMFLEGATDIVYVRGNYANMDVIRIGQATASTAVFQSVWDTFYNNISRCNNILDNMHRAKENVSETFYNRIEAEAKFLRAYNYFYLTSLYGDVPFVEHMLDWKNPLLPKTPVRKIIDAMYADLDSAFKSVPRICSDKQYNRITQGAVMGLKARMALVNNDMDVAAEAAWTVISSGVYSVYDSYEYLFLYDGMNSNEVILQMPFAEGVRTSQIPRHLGARSAPGYSAIVPTQVLVDMYQCVDGERIDRSKLYDPKKPFEKRDPRLAYSILYPGQWHAGIRFETHPDSIKTTKIVNGAYTRIANDEATHAYATFTGYLFRKYYDEQDLPAKVAKSSLNFMIMRYAEVLLTYAEAKIELGEIDDTVIEAINQVRRRKDVMMPPAKITMSVDELRSLVRYERTVELALEGHRLFDIHRWGIAEEVLSGYMLGKRKKANWYDPVIPSFSDAGKPVYPDERIFNSLGYATFDPDKNSLWFIPQNEIDRNPLLQEETEDDDDDW